MNFRWGNSLQAGIAKVLFLLILSVMDSSNQYLSAEIKSMQTDKGLLHQLWCIFWKLECIKKPGNGFSAEGTHFERVGITSLPQLQEEANVSRAFVRDGLG